ncbi:MAG: hypothetical protein WKG00_26855 [Polyangiaceae bacterium]
MVRLRLLAMAALAVACTTEDSVTPQCATAEACHPPPIGEVAPPEREQCGVDEAGAALTGVDLVVCLRGFGVEAGAGGAAAGGGGSGAAGGGGAAGGSGGTGGAGGSGGSGGTGGG